MLEYATILTMRNIWIALGYQAKTDQTNTMQISTVPMRLSKSKNSAYYTNRKF